MATPVEFMHQEGRLVQLSDRRTSHLFLSRCSNLKTCPAGNSSVEPYIVAHNLLNAHAAAAEIYNKKYKPTQHGVIGLALDTTFAYPLTETAANIEACERCSTHQHLPEKMCSFCIHTA
jgi:beta-glucosidase/6-phospho-beta-glucosidase/beta-galactosidase